MSIFTAAFTLGLAFLLLGLPPRFDLPTILAIVSGFAMLSIILMRILTRLQLAGAGIVAGMVAGLIAGIGARIAMRIVALAAGQVPEFTFATVGVLVFGMLLGIPIGLLFIVIKKYLPRSQILRGLLFGVILLVAFGLPVLLPPASPSDELSIGPPLLGRSLFGSLAIVDGLAIAASEGWFQRHMPNPRRHVRSILGYAVLVILSALGIMFFAALLLSTLLRIVAI